MTEWIQVNDTAIRYDMAEGPPRMMLVHELAGSLNSWDEILPHLPRATLRFDMPGSGMSEKVRGKLSLDDLVAYLLGLLQSAGAKEPITLVGAAVGGLVASAFAAAHPDRVERLILVGPALGVPEERRVAAASVADRIEAQGLRAAADAVLPKAMPEELWTDRSQRDKAVARWLSADPEGYAATYRMLIDADVSGLLPAIRCPVEVFAGRFDPFCTPEAVDAVTGPIRDRRYKVLDGGHFMHVQSPHILGPEIAASLSGR